MCIRDRINIDEKIYSGKYGLNNIESKKPVLDNSIYRIWSMTKPIVAVVAMQLIEKKINFGIVTNGSHYQYQKIKNTGLENKHNFVIASEIFGHSKPKKEIFLETLRLLNLTVKEVENVVFIGDNPYTDIIGAQSIGMKTIWISMGRKYPEALDPPNYIIENIKELDI